MSRPVVLEAGFVWVAVLPPLPSAKAKSYYKGSSWLKKWDASLERRISFFWYRMDCLKDLLVINPFLGAGDTSKKVSAGTKGGL